MRRITSLLAVPFAAACGAAAYLLAKRLAGAGSVSGSSSHAAGSSAGSVPSVPKNTETASYSFISGFQDAATVEVAFSYDADRFSYAVHEDSFLTESGVSHVGILSGEDFSVQFEYGTYYSGEDFAKLRGELSARHADLTDVSYGALSGLKYRDGDSLCLVFPIPEDANSYLLVALVKAPDNDDPLEALPDDPDLRFLLSSVSFTRR